VSLTALWSSARAALAALGVAVLAFGAAWWLSAQHQAARDGVALARADSANARLVDSLDALALHAVERGDSLAARWSAADSALARLLARAPVVDTLWRHDDGSGPAVPMPVVTAAAFDSLHRSCDVARQACVEALAAKDTIIARQQASLVAMQLHPIVLRDTVRVGSRWGIDLTAGPGIGTDRRLRGTITLGVSYRLVH